MPPHCTDTHRGYVLSRFALGCLLEVPLKARFLANFGDP